MDLTAKLSAVDVMSVKMYLRRQDVQLQLQQLQATAGQIDRELLCLDGERRALEALVAEAKPAVPTLVPKSEGAS